MSRTPRWLLQVREMIEDRYTEALTLQSLAVEAGVHPVTLAREHRRRYHRTIGEVIRQKRIDFAIHQILEGKQSLAEIAVSAGFYDQTHFTKIFKSFTGATPKEFRFLHK